MRYFIMCFSNFATSKKIVLETFCNNKNLFDEMKIFFGKLFLMYQVQHFNFDNAKKIKFT